MRENDWLDRLANGIGNTLADWYALMCTRDFWAILAVIITIFGFFAAAIIMLTDFSVMRMKNCFDASNLSAYLMFNVLMFFVFGGVMALGEAFNYFDNKRKGLEHTPGSVLWFVAITMTMGVIGLVMLDRSC